MENNEFDKLAVTAMDYDAGEPNEAVWRAVQGRIRRDRLPTMREILTSGLASAAVLLLAWFSFGQPPSRKADVDTTLDYRQAVRDSSKVTVAALSKIEGL